MVGLTRSVQLFKPIDYLSELISKLSFPPFEPSPYNSIQAVRLWDVPSPKDLPPFSPIVPGREGMTPCHCSVSLTDETLRSTRAYFRLARLTSTLTCRIYFCLHLRSTQSTPVPYLIPQWTEHPLG